MNKIIASALAGTAVAGVLLTGCKSNGTTATQASERAHALATSTAASQAAVAGKDLAGTCIAAKDLNRAYFVSLALNLKTAKALAAKCEIPKENIPDFAKAVISSASQAYLTGKFKNNDQRAAWAEKDLPVIVKKYQGKK